MEKPILGFTLLSHQFADVIEQVLFASEPHKRNLRMPAPDNEVVKMFQRYLASSDPSEIDGLDLQELVATEARLTSRGTNPTFTAVIKMQIAKLEQKENRRYESRIRAWNLFTGFILGLAIASVSEWAFASEKLFRLF